MPDGARLGAQCRMGGARMGAGGPRWHADGSWGRGGWVADPAPQQCGGFLSIIDEQLCSGTGMYLLQSTWKAIVRETKLDPKLVVADFCNANVIDFCSANRHGLVGKGHPRATHAAPRRPTATHSARKAAGPSSYHRMGGKEMGAGGPWGPHGQQQHGIGPRAMDWAGLGT